MRTDRRGSVTVESLLVLPIAIAMILLGRFILEASLNRQEAAVYARGSTVAAATARSTSFLNCAFDQQDFTGRTSVDQTAQVRCSRQNGERGLNNEKPVWDALEDSAQPWSEILRDVKPSRGPSDIVGRAQATLTMAQPQFIAQQNPTEAAQSYISAERRLWTHAERPYKRAHDKVIWDELCKEGTYWLFPNVFPNGGGPRC